MQTATLWPLVVCAGAVIVLVTSMLALSYVLGQRHQGTATGQPYESGIVSTGSAGVRLSAEFYLVAMFFVIFDLEAVFLAAWAVAFREVGWGGYGEVVGFIGIVLAALVYLWRQGALDRGAAGRTMPPRRDIECQRHCVRPRADGHPGIASSALHLA
jgi:NADH-quinone oxidoreductase subunit A